MFEKMTERFEQARAGDLATIICEEIESGADPKVVAREVQAFCVFLNMPIVLGAKSENRAAMVDFQCDAIKDALLRFIAAQEEERDDA